MKVIQNTNLESLKLKITNLPLNNTKYVDNNLDLTGLTLSVWEVYIDGSEEETFTDDDLETIKERYSVHISYKANENDGEGICEITIYTSVLGMEIKTTSEFTYAIGGLKPTTKGDVNNDGDFNVSDVVLFQKWLLAIPDTNLAECKAADFCEDERLDVFDLCLMKRELISNSTTTTYPVENPEVIDEFTPYTATLSDVHYSSKFNIIIKCQYSAPNRVWTINDFKGIDNIKSIKQSYQENPYRTI
ncbi:MAG: dockerin type I repeat-containing protein [Ruminococcus sp.]|nr:dockerin type I repeat-containing protein [Ruminococcus sp.]